MPSFQFELKTRVPALGPAVHNALAEHLERSSQELLAISQEEAPVDTGALRSSGFEKETGDLSRQVGYSAEYALYVHEGTVNHNANPWLARSAEQMRDKFAHGAGEAVKKVAGA